jgi:hypothetical protein
MSTKTLEKPARTSTDPEGTKKAHSALVRQILAARRVSVPLVSISTPDPAHTIRIIREAIDLASEGGKTASPILAWDIARGLNSINEAGKAIRTDLLEAGEDPTIGQPVELLRLISKAPENALIFLHMGNRWLVDPMVIQAIWNLRDQFKQDHRMLILLGPGMELPPELAGDVVALDEPLPDRPQILDVVETIAHAGKVSLTGEVRDRASEALLGLPAFQAEQVTAMSLSRQHAEGLDLENLWERKRRQIELTPGLKVHREKVGFADIGGVEQVKGFLRRILGGQSRPSAIVFIDEIEKHLGGAGGSGGPGDSSGVSQDQLGTLLSFMQDKGAAGLIFIGPPGSAKSMVAKAAGNEGGIPTIQLDLGAMKGSLVGQSEQNLRGALKVIDSVSNGNSLWIATCNAIGELPPELRRRFTLGTWFFDLPDAAERGAIWKIWLGKYADLGDPNALSDKQLAVLLKKAPAGVGGAADFSDSGWTGAEIRQCCDIGWRLGCPLTEAAAFVVPVSRSAPDALERLRKAADGRFLWASRKGVYARSPLEPKPEGRSIKS